VVSGHTRLESVKEPPAEGVKKGAQVLQNQNDRESVLHAGICNIVRPTHTTDQRADEDRSARQQTKNTGRYGLEGRIARQYMFVPYPVIYARNLRVQKQHGHNG
jgi:hypothetical protein